MTCEAENCCDLLSDSARHSGKKKAEGECCRPGGQSIKPGNSLLD